MNTVLLADAPAQAWRNGGGLTRELLTWPVVAVAAAADDWQLRVSVAEIARSGPFSAFAGIDRWFAVLHGAGVRLHVDGQAHTLRMGDPPLQFDGAAAPGCDLLGGPTQDLNLMLRRQAGSGCMQVAQAGADWIDAARWRALFATGAVRLSVDGRATAALPSAGLLWCDQAAGQAWRIGMLPPAGQAWWLCFQAAA